MEPLLQNAETMVWYLIGNPGSGRKELILLSLALFTCVLVMGRMMHVLHVANTSPVDVLLVASAGMAAMVMGAMVAKPWIATAFSGSALYFSLLGTAIVASLVVVVPVTHFLLRANALASVFSWATSLFAAMFVILIARTGIEALSSGTSEANKTKARTEQVQKFLNEQ